MRLLIVCRLLHQVAGGVERSVVTLTRAMAERGHDVHLLTWDHRDAVPYYSLSPAITWHRLDMGDPMRRAGTALRLARARRLRALARHIRPDRVVAFQHGPFLTVRLALSGMGIPHILAERNAPHRFDHLRAGKTRNRIFQSMRLADGIAVQLEGYRAGYPPYLRERISAIPNPVFATSERADPVAADAPKTLLTVARLSYQKNLDCLIRAFAPLASAHEDWHLRIVGDGEDRSKLARLMEDLGVAHRITLAGVSDDVSVEYRQAQLFCLPARWEGFPNAVAEALSHGLPAVGFSGCAGVNELIRPGVNGMLAGGNGDADALAATLATLFSDAALRRDLGAAAPESMARYAPGQVFDQWETLLKRVGEST